MSVCVFAYKLLSQQNKKILSKEIAVLLRQKVELTRKRPGNILNTICV